MTTFIQTSVIFLLICGEWCIVQGCKHDEHKVPCDRNVGVPGDLCPGVKRWECTGLRKRCACVKGTFQRWDGHCVPYRDCVFRTFYPDKLLSVAEDLIMVGLSTSIFDQRDFKCFISPRAKPVHYSYHRLVKYEKLVAYQWKKMEFDLRMISEYDGERVLAEEASDLLPYGMDGFPVLHASDDCIILARLPPLGKLTECTYWVRRSVVGNRNWRCDFIFDAFCKRPAIVVNKHNLHTCN
ncbi:uncharacterized protein [Dermacentor andersoni]|uniref:uncharacterized protein isoform X1 n=1 Tax=Dermacentor andersoni TaxID=34620 RepID=UPI002416AD32|nr:uncharacterized protein LOC126534730 isoform X1 [Dermacentor andersoni]